MHLYLIYVTTKDKEEARAIGRHVVQSRLAACVNIFDQMNSMYYWEDTFQDDQEAVLIAKTTEERVPELVETIKQKHSYDCPCVVSLPIQDGNPDFLQWIAAQVK
jgi:periplasmic divalent cation tolerance protein